MRANALEGNSKYLVQLNHNFKTSQLKELLQQPFEKTVNHGNVPVLTSHVRMRPFRSPVAKMTSSRTR